MYWDWLEFLARPNPRFVGDVWTFARYRRWWTPAGLWHLVADVLYH